MSNSRPVGLFGYLLRIFNVLLALGLALSYLSRFVSPVDYWILAFFGLAYPLFFLANFFFAIYWVFQLRWFALLSVFMILLGFSLPKFYVKLSSKSQIDTSDTAFKVMSYNVHDFDYYSERLGKNNEAYDQILAFINEQNPDIICFQEFYTHDKKPEKNNWIKLKKEAGFAYGRREKYNNRTHRAHLVILSKFKPIGSGVLENAADNKDITGIYIDLMIHGKPVRIYNLHLNSMGISNQTGYFTHNYDVSSNDDRQLAAQGAKRITSRMKNGYLKRALQAELVRNYVAQSPYPVIIAGDFNDTPCSYTFQTISKGLNDAFAYAGRGFSNTFNNGIYPSYRIDYLLFDENFLAFNYKRIKINASDHYPIYCSFVFNSTN